MSDNLSGLNLSVGKGEGAADVMQWGSLDRTLNQIYQEKKQREAQGYNEYINTQNLLQKELTNARSQDLPEIIDARNKYTQAKQALLFDKTLRKDPLLYAKKQQEANQLYGDAMQRINTSKEGKETLKADNQRIYTHPELHSDEAPAIISKASTLPTSKWNDIGYNSDNLLYKGNDYEPSAILKVAAGGTKNVPVNMGYTDDKKLETLENTYKVTDTNGKEFYDKLLQSMTVRDPKKPNVSPVKYWEHKWVTTPKEVVDQVNNQYQNLSATELEKYGLTKDPLEYKENMSAAEKAAVFMAQNHVLNSIPNKPISTKRIPDKKNIDENNFQEWLQKNKITSEQAIDRARLYQQYQREKEDANLGAPDQFIQNARTGTPFAGKEGEGLEKLNIKPIIANEYKITEEKPTDVIQQALADKGLPHKTKKVEVIPDFGMGKDGKIYGVIYQKEPVVVNGKPTGEFKTTDKVDWNKTKEIPSMQFKSTIINKALPSNFKVKQVTGTTTTKPTKGKPY